MMPVNLLRGANKMTTYDGKATGIRGIIRAIQWLGFKEWLRCSCVRHCLADEREVYEAKTGN